MFTSPLRVHSYDQADIVFVAAVLNPQMHTDAQCASFFENFAPKALPFLQSKPHILALSHGLVYKVESQSCQGHKPLRNGINDLSKAYISFCTRDPSADTLLDGSCTCQDWYLQCLFPSLPCPLRIRPPWCHCQCNATQGTPIFPGMSGGS